MNNRGDQNPNNRMSQSFAVFRHPAYSDPVERVLYALRCPSYYFNALHPKPMDVSAW